MCNTTSYILLLYITTVFSFKELLSASHRVVTSQNGRRYSRLPKLTFPAEHNAGHTTHACPRLPMVACINAAICPPTHRRRPGSVYCVGSSRFCSLSSNSTYFMGSSAAMYFAPCLEPRALFHILSLSTFCSIMWVLEKKAANVQTCGVTQFRNASPSGL